MEKEQIDKIEQHLKDILDECKVEKGSDGYFEADFKQIEHNVFEIREHLKNKDYE